jgi:EAL domain-containing protein (putative c-di-GMP-specific phosphodiesterase class I)
VSRSHRALSHVGVAGDPAPIVCAAIGLAPARGFAALAQGVQTGEQFDRWKHWGCQEMQGPYVADPLSPDEITPLLRM